MIPEVNLGSIGVTGHAMPSLPRCGIGEVFNAYITGHGAPGLGACSGLSRRYTLCIPFRERGVLTVPMRQILTEGCCMGM